jgi:hypothetical protein
MKKLFFLKKFFNTLEYAKKIYLAEGNESHSGKIKRAFVLPELIQELPENLRSRVVFVPVDLSLSHETNPFVREKMVRDAALTELKKDPAFTHDSILIIQDFDEFISPAKISKLNELLFSWKFWVKAIRLRQHFSYYKLNLMDQDDWSLAIACTGALALRQDFSPNQWRHHLAKRKTKVSKEYFGWHHSYLGDAKFIRNKIDSFTEHNIDLVKNTSDEQIQLALSNGQDLFGRNTKFKTVAYENTDPIPILQKRTDLMVAHNINTKS